MTVFYDYFDIVYGQHDYNSKRDLIPMKNGVPVISSKGTDQGIYGYFDVKPKYKHVISVPRTGSIGQAFYQGEECCIDDNCLVMIPKARLTIQEMIYFAMMIRKEAYKYAYGRQITPSRLGNTTIPSLPKWVNEKSIPSFEGFDEPMETTTKQLDTANWKEFQYSKLFDIKKGKRVIIDEIINNQGRHNFVSAIDSNNGVFCKTNLTPNQSANVISVNYDGNGVAEAFYQDEPFWALDSVNVLYPKFKLNRFIAMFLITLIKKEKYRFNYGRKWHKGRMEGSTIMLPVNKNGDPNWEFMESYIKSLRYSTALKKLSSI